MARVINTSGQKVREGRSDKFLPLEAAEYTVSVYDVIEGTYKPDSAGEGRDNYRVQLRVADGQKGANRRLFQTIGLFLEWGSTPKSPDGSDNFTFYDFFAAVRGVKSKDFRNAVKVWTADAKKDAEAVEGWLAAIVDEDFRAEVAEQVGGGLSVPAPTELLGKKVNVVLKIVPDTYNYKKAKAEWDKENPDKEFPETQDDFKTNDVASWKPFREVTQESDDSKEEAYEL